MARPKSRNKLRRTPPRKDRKKRVLIVCEGEKTEPLYIKGLLQHYRWTMVAVKGLGAEPDFLVKQTKKIRSNEKKYGDDYDAVFCVYDRDDHTGFEEAKSKAKDWGLTSIISWPCFEFWILLHFGYTRKPFDISGEKTPSQNCIKALQRIIPNYEKNSEGIFLELKSKLEDAKRYSRKALEDAIETQNFNPSTEFHKLVDFLQSLATDN